MTSSTQDSNTIFLTEQEAERIRNTVKTRIEQSLARKNHVRESRDPVGAKQQATGASLMADMGGAPDPDMTESAQTKDALPALGVGSTYAPCTSSLKDLQPMKLSELRMETHHRGRRLAVNRMGPVVTLTARSWMMVQDENGNDAERLEICLHKERYGEDLLESTKDFVIKEPYFTLTDQGEATIRIDHPSDLVTVNQEDQKQEKHVEEVDVVGEEKRAKRCKDRGNAALKEGDLPVAYQEYTEGIKIASQEAIVQANLDLARDIHRNRAHINLLLAQFDEAKLDGKASLTKRDDQKSKDLDSKAYFRAGSAAYNLAQFVEARDLFLSLQKLSPSDKDANTYLKRIQSRLKEQQNGNYEFKKLRAGVSSARPRVDAASFTTNTEIKDSLGRDRGLFALHQIAEGDLIMAEKAFTVVFGHEPTALTGMTYDVRDDLIRVSPLGLTKAIVQKLLNNPSQIESVMRSYSDWTGTETSKHVHTTADGPVIDVFRVHDIVSRNAFGPGAQFGEETAHKASTGFWPHAAYINHSCLPNARKEYIGDLMLLYATRAIEPGEEIFHAYDENADFDARQASLRRTWGFECKCEVCEAERADGAEIRRKRVGLVAEADAFVEKESWAGVKRLVLRRAQKLVRDIEGSYEGERWDGLPKKGAEGLKVWIGKASVRK
ncbi:SET domain-containing protein [Polyplosphaeria fusca]|uniref:SET domain-containing protein n=1 Tax=Polyplosphaeria fusca TaxID=682080 RepID=A0A9P4R8L8_9PLEO|nr:SET domain-containing protein [Polyplosphaeria fusca]